MKATTIEELRYFMYVEKELEDTFNYIEPDAQNMTCYSAKLASLLNLTCIEFESLSKNLDRKHVSAIS